MSTKKELLDTVRSNIKTVYEMPEINVNAIKYEDKLAQFIAISKLVGGEARIVKVGEDINQLIASLYPEAKTIASNLSKINIATLNPDEVSDPHQLTGIDLAVIEGQLGVAENGCVCIPQNVKHKVVYFIAEYLVILLDINKIVNNMHEAYDDVRFNDSGFATFISGPSKTADIEQSLVVGAHGAKGVTVLLCQ